MLARLAATGTGKAPTLANSFENSGVSAAKPQFSPILEEALRDGYNHMLLTIRTTHRPATDLGFLLHKHPEHVHTREFPFGNATVFYPEATEAACAVAVLLDVDPVAMVRGRGGKGGAEDQYVNDRPYGSANL